jgi:hypothetical protein
MERYLVLVEVGYFTTCLKVMIIPCLIRGFRFAFATAEVEATTAAAAKVAPSDNATTNKQSLYINIKNIYYW